MKTATFVKNGVKKDWNGDARVYRIDPPATYGWDDEGTTDHVVVSAMVAPYSGPETYIFPYDISTDEVLSWGEMDGSFRGGLDHTAALLAAGYAVTA